MTYRDREDFRTIGSYNAMVVEVEGIAGAAATAPADNGAQSAGLPAVAYQYLFNTTGWDRMRGPHNTTLLASGARGATQTVADQDSCNLHGVYVVLDITAVPGVDTVQLVIEGKDGASGKYYRIAEDAAQSGIGTRVILVLPGAGTPGGGINVVAGFPLPRLWRPRVLHSGAGSFTYSLGAGYVL